jgi:hypothetical protein
VRDVLIAEQLLLLCCSRGETPRDKLWHAKSRLLAIAVLAELAALGRLRFLAGLVIAPDMHPTSSSVLTDALAVLGRRQELSVGRAIDAVDQSHTNLGVELRDSMVRRGLLERIEHRRFLRPTLHEFRPASKALGQNVLDSLRRFAVGADVTDQRSVALFACAERMALLPGLLDEGELALGRKALQRLEAECAGTRAATDPVSERARLILALTHPGS